MGIPCSKIKKRTKKSSDPKSTQNNNNAISQSNPPKLKQQVKIEENLLKEFDEGEKNIRTDVNDRNSATAPYSGISPNEPSLSLTSGKERLSVDTIGLEDGENYIQLDPANFKGKSKQITMIGLKDVDYLCVNSGEPKN